MTKEIEVKMRLDDQQMHVFAQWLEREATMEGVDNQIDYYLDNPESSFLFNSPQGFKDFLTSLRIRMTDHEGDFLCNKVRELNQQTLKIVECDEYEMPIQDGTKMLKILTNVGYSVRLIVQKSRKIYRYGDFEIALDKVHDLGFFVEIELKNHDNRTHRGIARILDFLRMVGITKFKKLQRGYLSMLLNPGYDFTEW